MTAKVVILDRDGVINEDSPDYIKSPGEWRPIPGSLEAIARLNRAGFRVCVATNQSGVGRGLYSLETLHAIHEKMQRTLAEHGGRIEVIEFAPEHPDRATDRRKPGPGMLLALARRLGVSLSGVPVVGDSWRDLQAAQAAGARAVLVLTGNGQRTRAEHALPDMPVYADLAAFVDDWLAQESVSE